MTNEIFGHWTNKLWFRCGLIRHRAIVLQLARYSNDQYIKHEERSSLAPNLFSKEQGKNSVSTCRFENIYRKYIKIACQDYISLGCINYFLDAQSIRTQNDLISKLFNGASWPVSRTYQRYEYHFSSTFARTSKSNIAIIKLDNIFRCSK